MHLPTLGSLRPHKDVPEWLVSDPIPVPYFDGSSLSFILDGLATEDLADAEAAIAGFLKLGPADRQAASSYLFQNYTELADFVGADELPCEVPDAGKIWEYVTPVEIFVSRRQHRDRLIYLQITAECDWEPEYGLQIVYRKGTELSRVSDVDGHLTNSDAHDLPEDEDSIN